MATSYPPIVSVVPPQAGGSYTPGAQTTLDFAAAVINAAWNQANTKMDSFGTKIDGVEAVLNGNPIPDITADVASIDAPIEPTVTIPSALDAAAVLSTFNTEYLELIALLKEKFTTFQTTYFPNEGATFNRAELWLDEAFDNLDKALPPALAAQILAEAQSRTYAEASIATDALLATFAARRFPLPPGAAASGVLQIQQKSQDVVAEADRKLMLLYIEQKRFIVQQAMTLRQSSMHDTREYVKALALGPDLASRVVGIGYDAQSKLISSVSSYYGARNDAKRIVHQAEQFNVTTKLQKDEKNQAVDILLVEERIKTLLAEAQTLGQTAASLFNNLHASAGTSYSVAA